MRMTSLKSAALACLVYAAAPVFTAKAQENIDCGYPLNNSERTYCAEKALSEAEARMQEALDRLKAKLSEMDADLPEHLKGAPAALDDAQAAWKTYAEKDCEAYSFPFKGGTRGNELYRSCLIVLTMKRTEDLNATAEDYSN